MPPITPFYEMSEPGVEVSLLREQVTIKQGDLEATGFILIKQQWSPMNLRWEAENEHDFTNLIDGHVEIKFKTFVCDGVLCLPWPSEGEPVVYGGLIGNDFDVGSNHKLDSVTFHLLDYYAPDYCNPEPLVLANDEWQVIIHPYAGHGKLEEKASKVGLPILSGVGRITRIDGSQFAPKDGLKLLEVVHFFLSFIYLHRMPPLLAVGSNRSSAKSWHYWKNHFDFETQARKRKETWIPNEFTNQSLSSAFSCFVSKWSMPIWKEPMELAISWLVEASRKTEEFQEGIAFGQIPLEMLAWVVFVEDNMIINESEFGRLSAASKLQMLLAHCRIPAAIPTSLEALDSIARGTKFNTGPQLVTNIRNTIIHPNQKNRILLSQWKKKFDVDANQVRRETHALFRSYIALVLLYLIGYSGNYSSMLEYCDDAPVPWTTKL